MRETGSLIAQHHERADRRHASRPRAVRRDTVAYSAGPAAGRAHAAREDTVQPRRDHTRARSMATTPTDAIRSYTSGDHQRRTRGAILSRPPRRAVAQTSELVQALPHRLDLHHPAPGGERLRAQGRRPSDVDAAQGHAEDREPDLHGPRAHRPTRRQRDAVAPQPAPRPNRLHGRGTAGDAGWSSPSSSPTAAPIPARGVAESGVGSRESGVENRSVPWVGTPTPELPDSDSPLPSPVLLPAEISHFLSAPSRRRTEPSMTRSPTRTTTPPRIAGLM